MRTVNQNPADRPDDDEPAAPPILPSGVTWESLVLFAGGGWLPPDNVGDLAPKLLAVCLGKKADTVRGYVATYNLNVRQIGDEVYINPGEIRAKVPLAVWQGRKKRG